MRNDRTRQRRLRLEGPGRTAAILLAVAMLAAGCGSTVNTGPPGPAGGTREQWDSLVGAPGMDWDALQDPQAHAGGGSTDEPIAPASPGNNVATPPGGTPEAAASKDAGTGTPAPPAGQVTEPIELGFVLTDYSQAAQTGVDVGTTVTEKDIIEALVDAYNDQGGIAGREIVPVFANTDTASYEADFAAACARFTQDHQVAAVLGRVVAWIDSFEACLSKAGLAHVSASLTIPDAAEFRKHPLLIAPANADIESRSILKFDGALDDGILSSESKLGVIVSECPQEQRAWKNAVLPYIEAHRLNLVDSVAVRCGDPWGVVADLQNGVLRFKTAGVDHVVFVIIAEASPLYFFAGAAESQLYRPDYIVSSIAWLAEYARQLPSGQVENVHGYGWQPVLDVLPDKWPPMPAPAQRCLSILETKGIVPTGAREYFNAFNPCEAMFLYERLLTDTAGRTDGDVILGALNGVGTSFVSATSLEGRSRYSADRRDAAVAARRLAWTASCSCFTYQGPLRPIR